MSRRRIDSTVFWSLMLLLVVSLLGITAFHDGVRGAGRLALNFLIFGAVWFILFTVFRLSRRP